MPPNVLLVVLDTARRDAFEPYGGVAGTAPAIAQLARSGQALDAYAAASWTVPSHVAMLTGTPARALGLGQCPGGRPQGCRPVLEGARDRLLAEVLRRAGYATAAVSANLWLTPESGFDTGFDRFEVVGTARQGLMHREDLRARVGWAVEVLRSRVDDGAGAAERALARLIDEAPARPFFWFVNLVECHSPYLPPRPYNDLPSLERLRVGEEARRHLSLGSIWRACAGGFDVPDEALERMRHLYARSIRYMDDWLARLLERLDARGLLADTLVLVTSDHGENLGEGGLIGHAFSLDERLIRVPLVAAGPARVPADGVVSLLDLPRLIAGAVGLERHPWAAPPWGPGVAVAQFEPPTGPDDPRARKAVADWGLGEDALRRITSTITSATDGRRKLVRFGDEELAYHLASDPLELHPAAAATGGDGDGELEPLRAALESPLVWEAPAAAPAGAAAAPEPGDAADLERRMRMLGYL